MEEKMQTATLIGLKRGYVRVSLGIREPLGFRVWVLGFGAWGPGVLGLGVKCSVQW